MSEHEYDISSPLSFSFLPENFSEEYDNETNNINELFEQSSSEYEVFSMEKLFDILDSDTDYDTIDSENFQNDITDSENNYEKIERDEIINDLEQTRFTPCVIIDFVRGKIQRCGETGKLRQLPNLFGTWQVDREMVKEVDCLSKLGFVIHISSLITNICISHEINN